jgi:hypothetical protein
MENASSFTIVPSMPDDSAKPSPFHLYCAERLADIIRAGELTSGRSPIPVVVRQGAGEMKPSDDSTVLIFLKAEEHRLHGEIILNEVILQKNHTLNSQIRVKQANKYSIYNFKTTGTGKISSKGIGPKNSEPVKEVNWESFGYPAEPTARLEKFAGECTAAWVKEIQKQIANASPK